MEKLTMIFKPQYMKCSGHWIMCDGNNNFICKYLNIEKEKFYEIIQKYNGKISRGGHYFYNRDDCENFLNSEEFSIYLMMDKLTK